MKIVQLYPREMNVYGDTGNLVVLQRRLEWRHLAVVVEAVGIGDPLHDADILLGGGGQDSAQGAIGADFAARGPELRKMADDGVVILAVCGAYQMLGHEFVTNAGERIPGASVLDLVTRAQPKRIIGNIAVRTGSLGTVVGYENHSGLTTLGSGVHTALGTTELGQGNNGHDHTEGAVRDNVIGTYLHGPVLARAPRLADDLLRRAFARRGMDTVLEPLDDTLAAEAATVAGSRPR